MAHVAEKKKDGWWETVKTVFWALVIAMAFRSILFQPFSIPSGSMKPTLLVGDYLFVTKFSYGYSKYSLPFSPDLFDGRIFGSLPERGDVVVFKHPKKDACTEGPIGMVIRLGRQIIGQHLRTEDDCVDYIKRVIGLPGDEVQMIDGVLHINGQKVGMTPAGEFSDDGRRAERFIEELPGGVKHSVLNLGRSRFDDTEVIKVSDGHILFLGDNRDNSVDGRFPDVGQVPLENLIGRADLIALSSDGAFWQFWNWRGSRFFKSIE